MKRNTLLSILLGLFLATHTVCSQTLNDYRSRNSGNWNQTSTWERFDGSNWVNATAIPTSTAGVILIRQDHTVTITASVTIDQTIVEYGGKLVLSGGTLTLANGVGPDLLILGTYERISTTSISFNTSATAVCGATGTYIHNNEGGTIPMISWEDGSLLHIKKSTFSTSSTSAGNHLVQSFWDVYIEDGNDIRISGTAITSRTMVVRNNFNLAGGTFYLKRSGGVGVATSRLEVGNHFIQTGGNFNWNGDNEGSHIVQLFVGGDLRIEGGNWGGFVSVDKCECGVFFNGTGIQTYLSTISHDSGEVRDRFYYRTSSGPTGLHEIYQGSGFLQYTVRGSSCSTLPPGFTSWPTSGPLIKTLTVQNPNGLNLRTNKAIHHTLNLVDGLFTTSGQLTMNEDSTIDRSGGSIDVTPQGNRYNVVYSPHSEGYLTGPELPVAETVLFDVSVNNGHDIILAPEHQLLHINNDLTLLSGNLQVNAGYRVVLTNSYQNLGGMATFENNSSLVQINPVTNTGNLTYKRIAQQRRLDYVYWSSPTSDFQVAAHASNGPKFFWNTTQPNPNGSQGNWQTASGVLPRGKGVIVRGPSTFHNNANQDLENTFLGVPHNGTIPVQVQKGTITSGFFVPSTPWDIWVTELDDNWNLIGNPYPSSISAKQFLLDNAAVITDGVYIWTHGILPNQAHTNPFYQNFTYNYSVNDYHIYNLSGNLSGPADDYYIGAGQGFMVSIQDNLPGATAEVTFSNTMRNKEFGNHTGLQFFRTPQAESVSEQGRFWLDLIQNTQSSSRILVGYVEGATSQRDALFDAITKNDQQFKLYSHDAAYLYKIQGRGLPFDPADIIPLGLEIMQSGTYRLGLAFTDGLFSTDQPIYLKDKLLNTLHNLQSSYYEFTITSGVHDNRFEIVFQDEILGVSDPLAAPVQVFRNSHKNIEISSVENPIEEVAVFDLLGRTLYRSNYPHQPGHIEIPGILTQNIIVQVYYSGTYSVFKIR